MLFKWFENTGGIVECYLNHSINTSWSCDNLANSHGSWRGTFLCLSIWESANIFSLTEAEACALKCSLLAHVAVSATTLGSFCLHPLQLVMATQDLVAVSSPRCDHPGRLLSRVGGICCTEGFRGKSFLFAWSTLVQVLVLSNRSMTNLSIMFTASSGISFGPSIVHLSVPAVTSMLTMLSSFHVQQSWIQCHSMSKHHLWSKAHSYLVGCHVAKALVSSEW